MAAFRTPQQQAAHEAREAELDKQLLEALKRFVDTAHIETFQLERELGDEQKYPSWRSCEVWRTALQYAYQRLQPVQDEIHVIRQRLLELGVSSSSYLEMYVHMSLFDQAINEVDDNGKLLIRDDFWLEGQLHEEKMRPRLSAVATARAKRVELRKKMVAKLSQELEQHPTGPQVAQNPRGYQALEEHDKRFILMQLKELIDNARSNAEDQFELINDVIQQWAPVIRPLPTQAWIAAIRYAYSRLSLVQEEFNITHARLRELKMQADVQEKQLDLDRGVEQLVQDRTAYEHAKHDWTVPMLDDLWLEHDDRQETDFAKRLAVVSSARQSRAHLLTAE